MIKLSKNGITTLKKQYKSVLLKCLAINAGVFMMTVPAMATEITEDTVFSSDYDGAIYNSSDMGGQGSLYFGDELVISDGVNTANEHIIVGPVHDFENGNNIKITGGETTFVGRSLNTSSGAIEMSGGVLNFNSSDDSENDDLTLCGYTNYMMLLLLINFGDAHTNRLMDVIQTNMQNLKGYSDFKLEDALAEVHVSSETSTDYLFSTMGLVPEEYRQKGRIKFKVNTAFSY